MDRLGGVCFVVLNWVCVWEVLRDFVYFCCALFGFLMCIVFTVVELGKIGVLFCFLG